MLCSSDSQSHTGLLRDLIPFGGWFIVFETWSCHIAQCWSQTANPSVLVSPVPGLQVYATIHGFYVLKNRKHFWETLQSHLTVRSCIRGKVNRVWIIRIIWHTWTGRDKYKSKKPTSKNIKQKQPSPPKDAPSGRSVCQQRACLPHKSEDLSLACGSHVTSGPNSHACALNTHMQPSSLHMTPPITVWYVKKKRWKGSEKKLRF